jgi:hypothetical protein
VDNANEEAGVHTKRRPLAVAVPRDRRRDRPEVELAVQAFLESPLKLYQEPANGAYVRIALGIAVEGSAAPTYTACPDLP